MGAELRKEACTMALYVAICLLAALIALPETAHAHLVQLIWGVTVGLALAHWFAFRLSARLVGQGTIRAHDLESGGAQLGGAAGAALLATLAVLVAPDTAEREVAEYVLAALIGAVGFVVARGAGATRVAALLYACTVLVAAVAIAVVKNVLAGH
jgi:hypothetical protein